MNSNNTDRGESVFARLRADLHALAAESRLDANIRRSREDPGVGEAARRIRTARLRDVREQVEIKLAKMKEQIDILSAIVVRTPEGLSVAYMNPDCRFTEPMKQAAGPGAAEPAIQETSTPTDQIIDGVRQLDIEAEDYAKVSVVSVGKEGANVFLEVMYPPLEGWLEMVELVAENGNVKEKKTGIEVYMQDGKAEISNCPTGILKVLLPGGRSILFCIDTLHRGEGARGGNDEQ